ncbi:MAG: hypothetical protein EA359_17085 [Balneolaceae bacterium]|nr:MAG: hypothetical protein EA359_17085 [Balneolaceae bacterium]
MKIKSKYAVTAVFGMFLFFGLFSEAILAQNPGNQNRPTEHNLVVKKINDEWRVVYRDDETRSTVVVSRGDRVRWVVEGSGASFQFEDENLFGGNTRTVRAGNPLVLAVGNGARIGTYVYAVFIHTDQVFARGESPPRIIVER